MRKLSKLFKVTIFALTLTTLALSNVQAAENVNYSIKVFEDSLGIVVTANETDLKLVSTEGIYEAVTSIELKNAGTSTIDITSRVNITEGSFVEDGLILVEQKPVGEGELRVGVGSNILKDTHSQITTLGFDWDLEEGLSTSENIRFELSGETMQGTYTVPVVFTATKLG